MKKNLGYQLMAIFSVGLAFALVAGCNGNAKKGTDGDKQQVVENKAKPGDSIKLDPKKHYIYMTWDDSPQPPGTTECLRVFKETGIKVTFFSVGMNAFMASRMRILDTIRDGYPQFLLANHSHSHGFQDHYRDFYTHPDSAVADLMFAEKEMNIPVKIIRLPGSNSWVGKGVNKGPQSAKQVRDKLAPLGYTVIGWDIEWEQKPGTKTPKQSATEMVDLVKKRFAESYTEEQNAIVILSHDRLFGTPQYADSLKAFINALKADSTNVFETLDHYPLVMRK